MHYQAVRNNGKSRLIKCLRLRLISLFRVALARAIYGRCNTLVLDDIFSALDADTEAIVFSSLFGTQGLLKDKSVILATNHVYRLPYATWVTVIEDGRVAEQGDYNTLAAAEGYMARIVTEKNVGAKEGGDGLRKMQLGNTDDSLTEVETEQSAVNHESKQGKVAWATYRLYLRGMGARYATFCKYLRSWLVPLFGK